MATECYIFTSLNSSFAICITSAHLTGHIFAVLEDDSWIELDALENKQVLPQPLLPKLFFVIDFLPTDRVLQGATGW